MNYNNIDRELAFVHKKIGLPHPQPINFESEKNKILKNKTYNPILRYSKHNFNFNNYKKQLQNLKIQCSKIGQIFIEKKLELINKINLLNNIATPSLTKCSIQLYGKPNLELVNKAKKFLNLTSTEDITKYNTISTIKKFIDTLLMQGLNWKVKEKDMIPSALFNIDNRILYINKNRKFSDIDIKRLIVHEIGTHIVRAENAKKQKYRLFSIGFPNYLFTEEGLAVYNEEKAGLLSNDILKVYAGRVIAIDLALKNSFSTVYNSLLEFFPKEQAYTLTLRAKRGLSDTSKPGAYTKDYLYFKGWFDIKNFVKKGGDIRKLYIGKIGIEHVPLLSYFN